MNHTGSLRFARSLTLIALAGTAMIASPGLAQQTGTRSAVAAPSSRTVEFRTSTWLCDREVVNNNGEEIASVSDLIFGRGSGRIEYVIIKTGTTMGMGGRAIAIPFASFGWAAAEGDLKDRFVLATTAEKLAQFPEYTPKAWEALRQATPDTKDTLHQRLGSDAASEVDPYAGGLDAAAVTTITGEIVDVERVRTSTFGEQVEILIRTEDGSQKRVALGPSWYVNSAQAAPMRGDKVVVDAVALPRDPGMLMVGTSLRSGKRELRLRGTDGTPAWGIKTIESEGRRYSAPYSRSLLESDLRGMKIDCRGEAAGKVDQVIIDRVSGEIAFLSIDPNENFLGISDTKRLVPWSVATVTLEGGVRMDASKEMLLASPETPEDLSTLGGPKRADEVYKAFGVKAPKFTPPVESPMGSAGAWATRGPILTAIDARSGRTIEGKVTAITEVSFGKAAQPASAIKIRDAGVGAEEHTVLLGPAWYMDNQKATCQTGDQVKVEVIRTTIDGQLFWVARSVDCKKVRTVMLDVNNVPAWGQP